MPVTTKDDAPCPNRLESYIAMTRRNTIKLANLLDDKQLFALAHNAPDDEVFFGALECELNRWPERWRPVHRKRIFDEWIEYFMTLGQQPPFWMTGNCL